MSSEKTYQFSVGVSPQKNVELKVEGENTQIYFREKPSLVDLNDLRKKIEADDKLKKTIAQKDPWLYFSNKATELPGFLEAKDEALIKRLESLDSEVQSVMPIGGFHEGDYDLTSKNKVRIFQRDLIKAGDGYLPTSLKLRFDREPTFEDLKEARVKSLATTMPNESKIVVTWFVSVGSNIETNEHSYVDLYKKLEKHPKIYAFDVGLPKAEQQKKLIQDLLKENEYQSLLSSLKLKVPKTDDSIDASRVRHVLNLLEGAKKGDVTALYGIVDLLNSDGSDSLDTIKQYIKDPLEEKCLTKLYHQLQVIFHKDFKETDIAQIKAAQKNHAKNSVIELIKRNFVAFGFILFLFLSGISCGVALAATGVFTPFGVSILGLFGVGALVFGMFMLPLLIIVPYIIYCESEAKRPLKQITFTAEEKRNTISASLFTHSDILEEELKQEKEKNAGSSKAQEELKDQSLKTDTNPAALQEPSATIEQAKSVAEFLKNTYKNELKIGERGAIMANANRTGTIWFFLYQIATDPIYPQNRNSEPNGGFNTILPSNNNAPDHLKTLVQLLNDQLGKGTEVVEIYNKAQPIDEEHYFRRYGFSISPENTHKIFDAMPKPSNASYNPPISQSISSSNTSNSTNSTTTYDHH